jgi:hypothetical protein
MVVLIFNARWQLKESKNKKQLGEIQQRKFHQLQQGQTRIFQGHQPQQQNHAQIDDDTTTAASTSSQSNTTVGALCANISKEEIAQIRSMWLHDLTDLELTKETKDQLTKGLAFTATPREQPTTGILIATDQAATLLGMDTASATHLKSLTINGIKNYKPKTGQQENR